MKIVFKLVIVFVDRDIHCLLFFVRGLRRSFAVILILLLFLLQFHLPFQCLLYKR